MSYLELMSSISQDLKFEDEISFDTTKDLDGLITTLKTLERLRDEQKWLEYTNLLKHTANKSRDEDSRDIIERAGVFDHAVQTIALLNPLKDPPEVLKQSLRLVGNCCIDNGMPLM